MLEEVSKAGVQLILNEPFFGHFLVGIPKQESQEARTLIIAPGQSEQLLLLVNREYWQNEISDSLWRSGALKAQLLHVALGHVFRINDYGHKKIFLIATELVVNQLILREQLAPNAITLDSFRELGLRPNQGHGYYYQKLLELLPATLSSDDPGAGPEDSRNPDDSDRELLKQLLAGESQQDKLRYWQSFADMSRGEQRVFKQSIDQVMVNAARRTRDWGTLPSSLRESLQALIAGSETRVHWRRVLRLFTQSSHRTSVRNTIQRASKRFGTTPGIKIVRKQNILVAIDTSGSVVQSDLALFFSEIKHIYRQGCQVTIIECDATIQKVYPYRGITPKIVHGRGGTDFNDPIRHCNRILPDCLIYFTDGHAERPRVRSRRPILWVITPTGLEPGEWNFLDGRKLKL